MSLFESFRDSPPLASSDTCHGYKQMKAKLGRRHVRPWKWVPFINPARTDGAKLYHWRRAADEGKEYPFARFNKVHVVLFVSHFLNFSMTMSRDSSEEYSMAVSFIPQFYNTVS